MYRLSSKCICVERKDHKLFLYNRETHKQYLFDVVLGDMLRSSINGIEITDYEEYAKEIRVLQKCGIFVKSDNTSVLYRKSRFCTSLDTIQIEITRRCNFSCSYCYLRNITEKLDLEMSIIRKIIDQASFLGCINIDITGGEPLLHPCLKEILKYIYDKGMKTTLFTNGCLIDDEWCAFFKSVYLDSIKISIDSISEYLHCESRKENTLNLVLSNIEKLIQNNIHVIITTIVTKKNRNKIDEVIQYFQKKNSKIVHNIDSYVPERLNMSDPNIISPEEYGLIISERCMKSGLRTASLRNHYCGFAFNYLFVDSIGNIKLCPTLPYKFNIGNIYYISIEDCWNKVIKQFYGLTCKYKNTCKYYKYCAGGCRHRALIFSGDIEGSDSFMCRFYKIMEDNKIV